MLSIFFRTSNFEGFEFPTLSYGSFATMLINWEEFIVQGFLKQYEFCGKQETYYSKNRTILVLMNLPNFSVKIHTCLI